MEGPTEKDLATTGINSTSHHLHPKFPFVLDFSPTHLLRCFQSVLHQHTPASHNSYRLFSVIQLLVKILWSWFVSLKFCVWLSFLLTSPAVCCHFHTVCPPYTTCQSSHCPSFNMFYIFLSVCQYVCLCFLRLLDYYYLQCVCHSLNKFDQLNSPASPLFTLFPSYSVGRIIRLKKWV